MKCMYASFFLILFFGYAQAHIGMYPYDPEVFIGNHALIDVMFPQYSLRQIQDIALQLIDDLELLRKEPNALLAESLDIDYVLNLCKALHINVEKFINEETKTHYYLPDDIEYLIELCGLIEEKLMHILPCICAKGAAEFAQICSYIVDTRAKMDALLHTNLHIKTYD